MLTLLDDGSCLQIPRIVGKSLPHPVGTSSMLPNPPQCNIRQKIKQMHNFNNKIQNSLELRLDILLKSLLFYRNRIHPKTGRTPDHFQARVDGHYAEAILNP